AVVTAVDFGVARPAPPPTVLVGDRGGVQVLAELLVGGIVLRNVRAAGDFALGGHFFILSATTRCDSAPSYSSTYDCCGWRPCVASAGRRLRRLRRLLPIQFLEPFLGGLEESLGILRRLLRSGRREMFARAIVRATHLTGVRAPENLRAPVGVRNRTSPVHDRERIGGRFLARLPHVVSIDELKLKAVIENDRDVLENALARPHAVFCRASFVALAPSGFGRVDMLQQLFGGCVEIGVLCGRSLGGGDFRLGRRRRSGLLPVGRYDVGVELEFV